MIKFIKKHFFLSKFIIGVICLFSSLLTEKLFENYNLFISLPIAIIGYLIMSYDLYIEAFKKIKDKEFFSEETLTIIASIASIAIGEWVDGLAVILFFQLGEFFEDFALDNSRKSIESILSLRPKVVHLENNKNVNPEDINIGDFFIVKPGEIVPIDGIIIDGNSLINTSQITGESLPIKASKNDNILSGVININSPLKIKATKKYCNSTVARILEIIENSNDKKTNSEKFITRFAKIYTPIVISIAFFIALIPPLFNGLISSDWSTWKEWIFRGASMLVISCPCALVISIPMSFVVSIGVASKNKIIVKGTTYLELLAKANSIYLDKTGTITAGNFEISKIIPANSIEPKKLLELAKIAESNSNHPIAQAIIKNEKIDTKDVKNFEEIFGKGIKCTYKGKELLVGNKELFEHIKIKEEDEIGTSLFVFYDNKYYGQIIISDSIKENSKIAISQFKKNHFKKICMLTGDNQKTAQYVAEQVNIEKFYASLLPIEKSKIIEQAKNNKETTIFVGDGVNDAPSMILSNIGISMGQIGSESAIEASDIVILDDDLNKINFLKQLSRINKFVVYWNIIFSISIKVIALVLNIFGILKEYAIAVAIFADVGVTILCCINSLLIYLKRK